MEVKSSSRECHCLAASDISISPGVPPCHTPAGNLRPLDLGQSCRVGTRNGVLISAQGPRGDRDQGPT